MSKLREIWSFDKIKLMEEQAFPFNQYIQYNLVSSMPKDYRFSLQELTENNLRHAAESALEPCSIMAKDADYFKIINGELIAYLGNRRWAYAFGVRPSEGRCWEEC